MTLHVTGEIGDCWQCPWQQFNNALLCKETPLVTSEALYYFIILDRYGCLNHTSDSAWWVSYSEDSMQWNLV